MNEPSQKITPVTFSRRGFLRTTGGAMAGGALLGALAPERFAHAASGTDEIKIALVGCGGRGSGAANQALSTYALGPVKLVAMGDVHEDRGEPPTVTRASAHLQIQPVSQRDEHRAEEERRQEGLEDAKRRPEDDESDEGEEDDAGQAPLAAVWCGLSLWLGRKQGALAREREGEGVQK